MGVNDIVSILWYAAQRNTHFSVEILSNWHQCKADENCETQSLLQPLFYAIKWLSTIHEWYWWNSIYVLLTFFSDFSLFFPLFFRLDKEQLLSEKEKKIALLCGIEYSTTSKWTENLKKEKKCETNIFSLKIIMSESMFAFRIKWL